MKRQNLLYLILLPFGLIINFFPGLTLLNLACLTSVLLAVLTKKHIFVLMTLALLLTQTLLFASIKGTPIRQELARDPGKSYTTDMRAFLKTYYLMKSGDNFYNVFPKGMAGWIGENFHTDLAGWREPLPFYLWMLLPFQGDSIYYLGLVLVIAALLASFFVAEKFVSPGKALLSPVILLPYLFLPLSDLTLLQVEWWGLFFLIVGLAFYVHDHPWIAGSFFVLSLASREFFFIPILSIIIADILFHKSKNLRPIFICLALFCAFFFLYHLPHISSQISGPVRPAHLADWHVINTTFAYSSWNYLLGPFRPFVLLFFLTTLALISGFVRRKTQPTLFLLALYLPAFAFTLFVSINGGLTRWHDYWGIYYVPLLIIVSPIALATFLHTSSRP